MTPAKLKELRDGHKIITVARDLGLLKRQIDDNSKSSFNINCPNTNGHSHGDHRPSLAILPVKNRFHCYGCGSDGDVFNLIQLTKGVSLPEAIKWLDPNAELYPTSHQEAKKYLKDKGLSPETLSKFKVYVGETWDNDKQYECVYFPIPTGKKYRLFGCEDCKYKNGIGAGASIFKTIENPADDLVVLCEGELDAMSGWQNTEYPFWTSTAGANEFLPEWVDEFRKFNQIVVGFDNDPAGQNGAQNTIETLIKGGVDSKKIIKIEVPEILGKDWCDYFSGGMTKKDFDELIYIVKNTGG